MRWTPSGCRDCLCGELPSAIDTTLPGGLIGLQDSERGFAVDDEKDYKALYEESLKSQEIERKWEKEKEDDRKFKLWLYVVLAIIFGIVLISAKNDTSYDGGCDPITGYCEGPYES